MNVTLTSLKRVLKRIRTKDEGITFSRSTKAWHYMFFVAIFGICIGGIVAGYTFVYVENASTDVVVDPVETTRYHDRDIKEVLTRYDALKTAYVKDLETATTTKAPAPVSDKKTSTETAAIVASSTDMRVE